MEAEAAQVTPSGGDSEVGAASEPVIAAAPDPNPAKVPSDGAAANTPASAQTPKDSESKAEVTSDAAALSPAEHAVKLRAQGLEVAVAVTPPDMKDPLDRIRTNVALCAGGENAPKAEWLWRYWGMGPHKWREAIDGRHWKHGPAVYDYCLHGGNGVCCTSSLLCLCRICLVSQFAWPVLSRNLTALIGRGCPTHGRKLSPIPIAGYDRSWVFGCNVQWV